MVCYGKSKIWHPNGNLAQETIYENGVIISKTSWDEWDKNNCLWGKNRDLNLLRTLEVLKSIRVYNFKDLIF